MQTLQEVSSPAHQPSRLSHCDTNYICHLYDVGFSLFTTLQLKTMTSRYHEAGEHTDIIQLKGRI